MVIVSRLVFHVPNIPLHPSSSLLFESVISLSFLPPSPLSFEILSYLMNSVQCHLLCSLRYVSCDHACILHCNSLARMLLLC